MDSRLAFAMGLTNEGKPLKVFDWNKAARRIKEEKAQTAGAGLADDWEWTGGTIWNGGIVPEDDTYVYLASTWATPELDIDGTVEDCFVMEGDMPDEWERGNPAKIYWPASACKIIQA